MKRLLIPLLYVLFAATPIGCFAEIPLVNFFEHLKFQNVKISPDGKLAAFTYEEGSEVRLGVIELATMKPLSSFSHGEQQHVLNFYWGNNERVLMEVGKVTGNLDNMNRVATLFAANVDGSRHVPIFKVDVAGYRILSLTDDDDKNILISRFHWQDQGSAKSFKLNIYTGRLNQTAEEPNDNVSDLIADHDGKVRIALEYQSGETFDENEIIVHLLRGDKWEQLKLKSQRKRPDVDLLGFSADNTKAYFLSNHDIAKGDTMGVFEYNFNSRTIVLAARHADADVSGAIVGHDGEVLGVYVSPGKTTPIFFESTSKDSALLEGLAAAFPDQVTSITSYSRDGSLAILRVYSDKNPGDFYVVDMVTKKLKFLGSSMEKIDPEKMASMEPVTFAARDGTKITGFLTRPVNANKNLPLIVNVHGGPFGIADTWGFDSEAQFFASRGYATLQINYRGSGNRGRDFIDAGRREWGGKMQDDVTDGTLWAVQQGIADANRICIYGGSYGGYAALAGVIKEPDLYKCAVGYVGVYDMPLFREGDGSDGDLRGGDENEKWKSAYIGDDKETLLKTSPVHNVSRIKAALLLVHGENDVRVPIVHFKHLRAALDKIGKPYEWMVKEEGHGFYKVENRVALYTKMLDFFEQHIGAKKTPDAVTTN